MVWQKGETGEYVCGQEESHTWHHSCEFCLAPLPRLMEDIHKCADGGAAMKMFFKQRAYPPGCEVCQAPLDNSGVCTQSVKHVQQAELTYITPTEAVDHPKHYGGKDDPFEHVKVAEAKGWGYHIGNCTKYLWRLGLKDQARTLEDLKKARWYLDRYIQLMEKKQTHSRENHEGLGPHHPLCDEPSHEHPVCTLLGV